MTYRLRNISIAIVLAVVAALLTMFYTKSFQSNVRSDETNVPIYVAARDIPAGTSSANATAKGMLTKSEIVRRSVVPGAITKPEQLTGLVATQQIFAGEQITTRRFSAPSERGIHAQLTGIQRAVRHPGQGAAAPRRHSQDRRPRRRRRLVHLSGAGWEPLQPDHPPRHPRPACAGHRRGHGGEARWRRRLQRRPGRHRQPGAEALLGQQARRVALRAPPDHRRRGQPGERRERAFPAGRGCPPEATR